MTRKITTKKVIYQKYKKFIKQIQVSKIIKKGTLQESYIKWIEEVGNAINQVEETVRKNPRKDVKGAAEGKEESQDNNKKYNMLMKKEFSKTDLNY